MLWYPLSLPYMSRMWLRAGYPHSDHRTSTTSTTTITEIFAAVGIEQDGLGAAGRMFQDGHDGPSLSHGLMEELEGVLAHRDLPVEKVSCRD